MAVSSTPRKNTFLAAASASILFGTAVKAGADNKHVALATASTDKIVGISQGTPLLAEDLVEVALNGGGARALINGTVAFGDHLTPDSTGALIVTTTDHDRVCALAMDAGVAGDIIAVEVVSFIY